MITPYYDRWNDPIERGSDPADRADRAPLARDARGLPAIPLSPRAAHELWLLGHGALTPLDGFMDRVAWQSVVETLRLPDGTLFGLPITLPLRTVPPGVGPGARVALRRPDGRACAVLEVSEVWACDWRAEAAATLATLDRSHPLVRAMPLWGRWRLAGRVTLIAAPLPADPLGLRLPPFELRRRLAARGDGPVLAFQTRNALHDGHIAVIDAALARVPGATLLLHPVSGSPARPCSPTQRGAMPPLEPRLASYLALIERGTPLRLQWAVLPWPMRLAGPREAVLHAIMRRNCGATHLIVGRDHAGTRGADGRPLHAPDAAQALLGQAAAELDIVPVCIEEHRRDAATGRAMPASALARRNGGDGGTSLAASLASASRAAPSASMTPAASHRTSAVTGAVVWLTGLPSAGKTTLAEAVAARLRAAGRAVSILDGDRIRAVIDPTLGFERADRDRQVRRIGALAHAAARAGGIAICAVVSPHAAARAAVRRAARTPFAEVWLDTPPAICAARDPKGLWARAHAGDLIGLTGLDAPYEAPTSPTMRLDGTHCIDDNYQLILQWLCDVYDVSFPIAGHRPTHEVPPPGKAASPSPRLFDGVPAAPSARWGSGGGRGVRALGRR